jgi:hypothetical protein
MVKYKNRLIAAASAVMTAGAVAISGLTAASASPAVTHRVSGTEHFQVVNASEGARAAGVIATGVFTAGGADIMGSTTDTFRFPGGTFRVMHSPGRGTQNFDPRTCLAIVNLRGTFKLGHGTGRYAGISGHGTYTLSILEIAARSNGKCSFAKTPGAFQQILRAQGPVHL